MFQLLIFREPGLSAGELSTNQSKAMIILTNHRRVSKDDWLEWHRRLSIELLKESPSPALRSCWTVAQQYAQLARDLFNAR